MHSCRAYFTGLRDKRGGSGSTGIRVVAFDFLEYQKTVLYLVNFAVRLSDYGLFKFLDRRYNPCSRAKENDVFRMALP